MTRRRSRQERANGVELVWADDRLWARKLARDREVARVNQTPEQWAITEVVARRALQDGAEAIALTGSTARGRRTRISDLDYHVVGRRPDQSDLPGDIDIYAGDTEHFWGKLRSGDDFVQWTLRFGCVLHDSGIFRAGLEAIATERLWPDPQPKFVRVPELATLASRLVDMGDRDAGEDQVRAALTSAARALLLKAHVFPLARSELAEQLRFNGHRDLAAKLDLVIHGTPSLPELRDCLVALELVLQAEAQPLSSASIARVDG